MAVIGYIRLSPGERKSARGNGNADAFGAEAQRSAITYWAMSQSLPVAQWFEDIDVTGAADIDHRPGLMAAMAALGEGDALVVAKRDRLARDVVIDAMVTRLAERVGAFIFSADGVGNGSDPASGAMRGMMAVFAQFERAVIGQRIKAALTVKRTKGEHLGPVPFGYKLDKSGLHLEPHPAEQEAVRLMVGMRQGGASLREIGAELAARGIRSPRSKSAEWSPSAVNALIRRESSANLQPT